LDTADPDRRLFASFHHGYRLEPPLEAADLRAAENLLGCPLPEDYREFVTVVGAGGAGPYYGVKPLADAVALVEKHWGLPALAADSPLEGDIDFGELLGQPDDWDAHVARLEDDPEYAAGWDRMSATYLEPAWFNGRLPIADYGDGDWLFLVVGGARRGTVWADCVSNATGLYCLEVDFVTWYERWLDDALGRAERGDFELADPLHQYPVLRFGDNPRYRRPDG
jgi:hypothetical protein